MSKRNLRAAFLHALRANKRPVVTPAQEAKPTAV